MWIEDLRPAEYSGVNGIAVGWLSHEHSYLKEKMCSDDIGLISTWLKASKVIRYKGYHYCDLCGGEKIVKGKVTNPHRTDTTHMIGPYMTTGLLLHYIWDHGYRPPEQFLNYLRARR